jgi:hypothetical protein
MSSRATLNWRKDKNDTFSSRKPFDEIVTVVIIEVSCYYPKQQTACLTIFYFRILKSHTLSTSIVIHLWYNLYSSQNIIRMIKSLGMRWVGCAKAMRNVCKTLIGKSEGNRLLERHRRRWEDNIKMDLKYTGWKGVEWNNLARDTGRSQTLLNTR